MAVRPSRGPASCPLSQREGSHGQSQLSPRRGHRRGRSRHGRDVRTRGRRLDVRPRAGQVRRRPGCPARSPTASSTTSSTTSTTSASRSTSPSASTPPARSRPSSRRSPRRSPRTSPSTPRSRPACTPARRPRPPSSRSPRTRTRTPSGASTWSSSSRPAWRRPRRSPAASRTPSTRPTSSAATTPTSSARRTPPRRSAWWAAPRPTSATAFLLAQQCDKGYFRQYFTADKTRTDQSCQGAPRAERGASTDATALAVLALQDVQGSKAKAAVKRAVDVADLPPAAQRGVHRHREGSSLQHQQHRPGRLGAGRGRGDEAGGARGRCRPGPPVGGHQPLHRQGR